MLHDAAGPDGRASRLEPIEEASVAPFVRAAGLADCSLYWMPVSGFPVNAYQRRWLLEFADRLASHFCATRKLRQEVFVHFKSLYPDRIDIFSEKSVDFIPISGAASTPGVAAVKPINLEDLQAKVKEAERDGTLLDVQQWMPDRLYWFVNKQSAEQREVFCGYGGLLSLFLPPDAATAPPEVELPRYMRTQPGITEEHIASMQRDIQMAFSLRDKFLEKSKEVFGADRTRTELRSIAFALPYFTSAAVLASTPDDRAGWFDVFEGYLAESVPDKGVLLLVKDAEFDAELAELLTQMREDGHTYR